MLITGVQHVVDTSFSRELGLLAAQREFVASFRAAVRPLLPLLLICSAMTRVLSAAYAIDDDDDDDDDVDDDDDGD